MGDGTNEAPLPPQQGEKRCPQSPSPINREVLFHFSLPRTPRRGVQVGHPGQLFAPYFFFLPCTGDRTPLVTTNALSAEGTGIDSRCSRSSSTTKKEAAWARFASKSGKKKGIL